MLSGFELYPRWVPLKACRTSYNLALKLKIVAEAEAVKNNSEITREYGISESMVRRWRKDQANLFSSDINLYFIRRTSQPGHYRFFLIPPKTPYSNQASQKNTCQIFVPKKIPESKISNPKKSFDHPCHLKSRVPPPGYSITAVCITFFP